MSSPQPAEGPRRKKRGDRHREILDAAARVGLTEGLSRITARRVAQEIGVRPGLVTHYFPAIDELITAAFVMLSVAEREEIRARGAGESTAVGRIRLVIDGFTAVSPERDAFNLLWLDALRQAADRPLLRDAVTAQMESDIELMENLISAGMAEGEFDVSDSAATVAMRILALVDAQLASSAVRGALSHSSLDYPAVEEMLVATAERELGLQAGALSLADGRPKDR